MLQVSGVRRLVLALTALAIAPPLSAQKTQQPPAFRSSIELVQVDVVVTDHDGTPVRGLTSADFLVLDRRKPQTIANFEEVSHERPSGDAALPTPPVRLDVANNRTAQSNRLIVMVVDDLHIYKDRTDRAKDIARKVLADLGPQSSMAVLFTSGDRSTQVTQDRTVLAAAVETLKARQSWRRPHQANDVQKAPHIDPEMSSEQKLVLIGQAQETSLQDYFDNMSQFKTLQDAARMLGSGDARRKAFILLSEGIGKDLSGIFGAMAPAGDAPEGGAEYGASGNAAATMTVSPTGYHALALIEMMDAMRRSNVATYAIDPRGHVGGNELARECFPPPSIPDPCSSGLTDWSSQVRQAQHGLEMLSEASGGFAVTNSDDFTSGLEKIVADLDHYYLLGFYPSDPKGKDYRPLEVRIAGHRDWTLRFRRGYLPGGPPAPPKNSDPLVALSAGILPRGDLPLRLTAIAFPGAGRPQVTMALEVSAPVRDLQDPDGRLRDSLKYEVLVVDEAKKKVMSLGGLEGRLTLSTNSSAGTVPGTVSYQVGQTIALAPGRYQLRVSAFSARLARGGSVYLNVEVPDFAAAPLALSGLIVGYADGPRVPVAPTSATPLPAVLAGGRAAGPAAAPAALPFAPSLDREFTGGDTLRLYYQVLARDPRAPLTASVDIVDASDRVVRSYSPSFSMANGGRVDLAVPLAGLAGGAYRLRATVANRSQSAMRELGFVVK